MGESRSGNGMTGARMIGYRSDRAIRGRLLTVQVNPLERDVPAKYRPWLGAGAAVELRPEYRRFQCTTCGRVDKLKCFRRGLPADFAVPEPRADLHVTEEYISIWSRRLADHVCAVAAKHVRLFELPGDRGYVVPWPTRLFTVPDDAPVRSEAASHPAGHAFCPRTKRCRACGRYQSTTFWAPYFRVPDDVVLAAVSIDTADYLGLFDLVSWIVSPDVAHHMRRQKFSNLRLEADLANS